jgi:aldose 1-epimerase
MTHREDLGPLPDGRNVEAYALKNANGLSARILTLGGALQSFFAPDRDGTLANITLGWPDAESYLTARGHLGVLVGRFANRIAGGRFTLDGKTYDIPRNAGENTLHGGTVGFNKAVWKVQDASAAHLVLSHISPDGDQGFPGTLTATVRYSLGDNDALQLDYMAVCDAPTVVNLTNHAYWNLAARGDVLDHTLQVDANAFTPVDATMIPTGAVQPVAGTPFDFRKATRLRERVTATDDPQIALANGIDHNFVITHRTPGDLEHAATVTDAASGRVMAVWTTEPGMQVYTANGLASDIPGTGGERYTRFGGIALETQHFPNSPNEPSFPSTALRPGETFRSTTRFVFTVLK